MMMGFADFPIETMKLLNIHPDCAKGKASVERPTAQSHPSSASGKASMNETDTPDATTPQAGADASQILRIETPGPETSSRTGGLVSGSVSPSPSGSRPSSRNPSFRGEAGQSFADKLRGMNVESAATTGKGMGRIVGAGFKSPMDFTLNVAKGFHNVPKLYGGEVRQVDKVTNFQSGVKTAAKVGTRFHPDFHVLFADTIAGIGPRLL